MTSEQVGGETGPALTAESELWRRIPGFLILWDLGRAESSAFDDRPRGDMSVYIADDVRAAGRSPESLLADLPDFGLASITVGLIQSMDLWVERDPLPEEPAHAVVKGAKTDSMRRRMAKAAVWVVLPPRLS